MAAAAALTVAQVGPPKRHQNEWHWSTDCCQEWTMHVSAVEEQTCQTRHSVMAQWPAIEYPSDVHGEEVELIEESQQFAYCYWVDRVVGAERSTQ